MIGAARQLLSRPAFRREWITVAVVLFVLTLLASGTGWFARLDQTLYDLGISALKRPPPRDIVIVAIDQPSLDRIGRWPWPRAVHATLVSKIAAAAPRALALDILFSEPTRGDPSGDASLAEAIRRAGTVVLPVVMELAPGGAPRAVYPVEQIGQAAAALGHVHLELDKDGIARSVFLREGPGRAEFGHMALALAEIGTGAPLSALPGATRVQADDRAFDLWVRDHRVHLSYLGPPGHVRRVSYIDVLLDRVPAEVFRGKYVLVGATASGMQDSFPTPVSGHARAMPGVELTANVLEGLLSGTFIRIVPAPVTAGASAALVLVLLLSYLGVSPRRGLAVSALACAGALLGAFVLMRLSGWWFAPASAVAGMLLCYPVWSWRRLEATQRHMEEELEHFSQDAEALPFGRAPSDAARTPRIQSVERRIEEVRAAAARVRELRRFVSDTLNGLPQATLVVDAALRISLANAAAAALANRSIDALAGASLEAVLEDLRLSPAPQWARWVERAPIAMEAKRDGGGDYLVSAVPFSGNPGERRGLLVSLVDISVMKDAERKREEYMRFLSHDLRSPLVSITALLDLHELAPKETPDDFHGRIRRSVERSLALADDFVQLGRAESIDAARFAPVDLVELARHGAEEVDAQARAKRIKVSIGEAPEQAMVSGMRDVLQRVLINLLSNAVKYSPEDTAVTCSVQRDKGRWVVVVQDQGYGVSAADLPRLFDRFERLDAAKRKRESGAGLGLAFVKTATDKHHGTIDVQSEIGKGSRFAIAFPASDAGS